MAGFEVGLSVPRNSGGNFVRQRETNTNGAEGVVTCQHNAETRVGVDVGLLECVAPGLARSSSP